MFDATVLNSVREGLMVPCRVATVAAAVVLLVAACTGSETSEADPDLCGEIFNSSSVTETLKIPIAEYEGDTGIRFSYSDSERWSCFIHMPEGGTIELTLHDRVRAGTLGTVADAPVSIGEKIDGVINYRWASEVATGYVAFGCEKGTGAGDGSYSLVGRANRLTVDSVGYREIGLLFTMAANGLRARHGCEGESFPLPVDLPDAPELTTLEDVEHVCETFPVEELSALLPVDEDGVTEWRSPGSSYPAESCQVWRKPTGEQRQRSEDHEQDAPGSERTMYFSRITGALGDAYDLDDDVVFGEAAEPWASELSEESYVNDSRYRVMRFCDGVSHVYLGSFAQDTVSRTDYEALFERRIVRRRSATGARWGSADRPVTCGSPVPRGCCGGMCV
ncbi:hypothetical protein H0B56_03335 [Haloechinothrix sp. YIM 98757]|uniref:Uncharacterized protein n=1 Tax=Haloechinothrix aidingensis TaxID=2752311 RepID=A0A838A655_9PSEU|nr:hypothetical protein [Haloechinothrix aidingensis]MBA0124568.1 hypothetical protein [Haloechinothrix aidingensis]